jgi:hypothetical protein
MQGNIYTFTGGGLQPYQNPDEARTIPVVLAGGVTFPMGQVLGLVPGTGTAVNEVQTGTVTGTSSGGSVNLIINGQQTVNIAFNATAAVVQAALETILGVGNITCAGGPWPGTPVTFTFVGALAGRNTPMLAVINNLTGTTPVLTMVETTPGKPAKGYWKDYNDALSDGSQVARAILKEAVVTNADGSVQSLNATLIGGGPLAASAFVCGTFRTVDLIGLDAAGVTDFGGRIIAGIAGTLTDPTTIMRIG